MAVLLKLILLLINAWWDHNWNMPVRYIWNPFLSKDINILESIQNRAARWICAKWDSVCYAWSKSTNDCLSELCWPTLETRRTYLCICFLYDILHQRYALSFNSYCGFKPLMYVHTWEVIHYAYKLFLPASMPINIHCLLIFLSYGTHYPNMCM